MKKLERATKSNKNFIYVTDDLYKFSTLQEALKHANSNEECTKITKKELYNTRTDELKECVVWTRKSKTLNENNVKSARPATSHRKSSKFLKEALKNGDTETAKKLEDEQQKLYDEANYEDDHNNTTKAISLTNQANELQKQIDESKSLNEKSYDAKYSVMSKNFDPMTGTYMFNETDYNKFKDLINEYADENPEYGIVDEPAEPYADGLEDDYLGYEKNKDARVYFLTDNWEGGYEDNKFQHVIRLPKLREDPNAPKPNIEASEKIYNILSEHDIWADVEPSYNNEYEVDVYIEGDWKHSHLAADYYIKQLYPDCRIDERVTNEDGSDWYESVHRVYVQPVLKQFDESCSKKQHRRKLKEARCYLDVDSIANTKIKDWYKQEYPDDEMGDEINGTSTFQDVIDIMHDEWRWDKVADIYQYCLGVVDSVIFERVIDKIAKTADVDYSELDRLLQSALVYKKDENGNLINLRAKRPMYKYGSNKPIRYDEFGLIDESKKSKKNVKESFLGKPEIASPVDDIEDAFYREGISYTKEDGEDGETIFHIEDNGGDVDAIDVADQIVCNIVGDKYDRDRNNGTITIYSNPKYTIKYWYDEDARDLGEPDEYDETFDNLDDAKEQADRLFDMEDYASVEVYDENDEVVYGRYQEEYEDDGYSKTFDNIPTYANTYMAYGDVDNDLTDEDIENIDRFMEENNLVSLISTSDRTYFCPDPAFGEACDCFEWARFSVNNELGESKKSKKKKDKVRFVGDMGKEISFFNRAMGNNATADGGVGSVAVAEDVESTSTQSLKGKLEEICNHYTSDYKIIKTKSKRYEIVFGKDGAVFSNSIANNIKHQVSGVKNTSSLTLKYPHNGDEYAYVFVDTRDAIVESHSDNIEETVETKTIKIKNPKKQREIIIKDKDEDDLGHPIQKGLSGRASKCGLKESWHDFDEYEELIDEYMQPSGEGDTKASQCVTAVNKLVYKWFNDGDVYDNTSYMRGWANDLSSYANWLWKYIPESRIALKTIRKVKGDDNYEALLKNLCDSVLNEQVLNKLEQEEKQGSIYDCDGPFAFIDKPEREWSDDYEGDMKYYRQEVKDWHKQHRLK